MVGGTTGVEGLSASEDEDEEDEEGFELSFTSVEGEGGLTSGGVTFGASTGTEGVAGFSASDEEDEEEDEVELLLEVFFGASAGV